MRVAHSERVQARILSELSGKGFLEDEMVDIFLCEVPVMRLGQSRVFVRVRLNETIDALPKTFISKALKKSELDEYTFLSVNQMSFEVLPLPVLTDVRPSHIFNLATVRSVSVKGTNFVDKPDQLLCIYKGLPSPSVVHRVKAVFESVTSV